MYEHINEMNKKENVIESATNKAYEGLSDGASNLETIQGVLGNQRLSNTLVQAKQSKKSFSDVIQAIWMNNKSNYLYWDKILDGLLWHYNIVDDYFYYYIVKEEELPTGWEEFLSENEGHEFSEEELDEFGFEELECEEIDSQIVDVNYNDGIGNPEGYEELVRDTKKEQKESTTYGHESELNETVKHVKKGDRIVLNGKIKGSKLVEILLPIVGESIVENLDIDLDKTYGADLMTFSVSFRDQEDLERQIDLWGDEHVDTISKSQQMKYGEGSTINHILHNLTYAAAQLTGVRQEYPIPTSVSVIELGVLNPDNPWNNLTDKDFGTIAGTLFGALRNDPNGKITDPGESVYEAVHRIKVKTLNWTFRYTVSPSGVNPVSATFDEKQHKALLSSKRPAKDITGERKGKYIPQINTIQTTDRKPGQKRFVVPEELRGSLSEITVPTDVDFIVDESFRVTQITRSVGQL